MLFRSREPGRLRPLSWRVLVGVVVCLLVASAGVYYALFGCFFLVVAGLCRAAMLRRAPPLFSATFFSSIIALGVAANLLPNLHYQAVHGCNPPQRAFSDAELFSLQVTQMLLPVPAHRLSWLRDLRERYDAQHLHYEVNTASLGLLGSAGFLLLVGRIFWRRTAVSDGEQQEEGLAMLNAAGLMLATTGSFGCFAALTVSPAIRGYTRISIYLAFFAFFAMALVLDRFGARYGHHRLARWSVRCGLVLVLVVGLWDQTSPELTGFVQTQHETTTPLVQHDAAFVRAMESQLPVGAMVFQLPYMPFPECGNKGKMIDYDHFRLYLQSKTLRWSYGAMRNRPGDLWQANLAAKPVEEMVSSLVYSGFSGICINRDGYADAAQKLEADLRTLLDIQPLQSGDGKLLFFDLTSYYEHLHGLLNVEQWARRRERALHPLALTWGPEFHPEEGPPPLPWRWCGAASAAIYLENTLARPRPVSLQLQVAVAAAQGVIVLEGTLGRYEIPIEGPAGAEQVLRFTVPPGKHCFRIGCNTPGRRFPGDPRELYFRVTWALREVDQD